MNYRQKVIFRADGNAKMGLGHVIRSLALADMLKDDFDCHFIIRDPLPTLKEQILEVCSSIKVLNSTDDDIAESKMICATYLEGTEIVVLDGYHFRTQYQQNIKQKGCKLVCIDDIHDYHFVADVVINHAGGIAVSDYSAEPYTQFCLGLKYALLRRPFREAANNRIYEDREENSVFICLGGADPNNDTLSVLKQFELIANLDKCYLILGSAYLHKNALNEFLKETFLQIELLSNLSAEEMVYYMRKCGKAVTPPSSVSIEYLSVGGRLYLKVIAENQRHFYNYCIKEEIAFKLNANNFQRSIKEIPKNIVDGNQENRLIQVFNQI